MQEQLRSQCSVRVMRPIALRLMPSPEIKMQSVINKLCKHALIYSSVMKNVQCTTESQFLFTV